MRTNQHSIAQDHLPPGLCESGKHTTGIEPMTSGLSAVDSTTS